jgi:hypothetical protein
MHAKIMETTMTEILSLQEIETLAEAALVDGRRNRLPAGSGWMDQRT